MQIDYSYQLNVTIFGSVGLVNQRCRHDHGGSHQPIALTENGLVNQRLKLTELGAIRPQ